MKIRRYDRGEIRSAIRTPEGFLKADAIVTRTGVLTYSNIDGTLRRELRHPDDIFMSDSLNSMKGIPITKLHPPEKEVNSQNAKRLSVGFTGEKIKPDGKFVKTSVTITDQNAIDSIEAGMQELSLGYNLVLVEEVGEYNGERYDFRQTEVEYNHLAIVPQARAGHEARIALDADDAVEYIEKEKTEKTKDKSTNNQNRSDKMDLIKINIDGLVYEASPEVDKFLKSETKRADTFESEVKTLTESNAKLQANFDQADAELKKLQAQDNSEMIRKAVDCRITLEKVATPHLDEETVKNISSMSEKEIKIAVINAKYPDIKLDEKADAYIDARFDGVLELKVEASNNDGAMADQRKKIADTNKDAKTEPDQLKSRQKNIDEMKDAWKTAK